MGWAAYHLAENVREALEALAAAQGEGRIIAGGTDLVIQLRRAGRGAAILVDITRIPGLNRIEKQGNLLVMGALVTHAQAAASPIVRQHITAVAEACAHVGSPQIRNVGTLVGNIVSAQPGADAALALHAFDTQVRVAGRAGVRTMALPDLYEGLGLCCIDSCRELITHLIVPLPQEECGSAFERLSQRRTLTLPVVNTAVSIALSENTKKIQKARVVVGPVSSTPFRASEAEEILQGSEPTMEAFGRAARAAAEESRPRASLLRGGKEYRQNMVEVMVRRALMRATERGKGICQDKGNSFSR
ncbi:MAG: FAD binding domain-containing protein [Deltaproteobacteria bacterium]|nr:FAD binding domain-containing protein [Deltaproteobacteria bacterium]